MMRYGFTLVELIIAMAVSMLVIGGISLRISDYWAKEKINRGTTEIVAALDLARNLAVTNQKPAGFSGLDYVAVTVNSAGRVSAFPVNNSGGTGAAYFSTELSVDNLTIGPTIAFGGLQFGAGTGKMVGKNSGSFANYPLPPGQTKAFTISSAETTTKKIISASAMEVTSR